LFSRLKALLKKAAHRTVDALWDKIGKLLDTFSAQECETYFASSGYVNNSLKNALTLPVTVCCPTETFQILPKPHAGSNTVE
jgi:hypothetical protein